MANVFTDGAAVQLNGLFQVGKRLLRKISSLSPNLTEKAFLHIRSPSHASHSGQSKNRSVTLLHQINAFLGYGLVRSASG
jgi:hypothetical protein